MRMTPGFGWLLGGFPPAVIPAESLQRGVYSLPEVPLIPRLLHVDRCLAAIRNADELVEPVRILVLGDAGTDGVADQAAADEAADHHRFLRLLPHLEAVERRLPRGNVDTAL